MNENTSGISAFSQEWSDQGYPSKCKKWGAKQVADLLLQWQCVIEIDMHVMHVLSGMQFPPVSIDWLLMRLVHEQEPITKA